MPAASTACTRKMYVPSPRPEYPCGDEHGVKPVELMLHTNVDPGSLLVNANVAAALLLTAGGPLAIAVPGATVSTLQVYVVDAPRVPPAETVRTLKVWNPSPNPP